MLRYHCHEILNLIYFLFYGYSVELSSTIKHTHKWSRHNACTHSMAVAFWRWHRFNTAIFNVCTCEHPGGKENSLLHVDHTHCIPILRFNYFRSKYFLKHFAL
jgi:hypothetical protein